MHVELRDEARADLLAGALFYDLQSEGLGEYFIDSLRDDLRQLERTYGVHEIAYGFHRKLAGSFPFSIYYLVANESVDVVAILDCREDPQQTRERLGRTID